MLREDDRRACVQRRLESRRTKVPGRCVSGSSGIESAYSDANSSAVAEARGRVGAKIVGPEIGLTPKPIEVASKSEPDYGYVFLDLVPAYGARVVVAAFCAHQVERGYLLLSGSFTRPVWAAKGDGLHASFGPVGALAAQLA